MNNFPTFATVLYPKIQPQKLHCTSIDDIDSNISLLEKLAIFAEFHQSRIFLQDSADVDTRGGRKCPREISIKITTSPPESSNEVKNLNEKNHYSLSPKLAGGVPQ